MEPSPSTSLLATYLGSSRWQKAGVWTVGVFTLWLVVIRFQLVARNAVNVYNWDQWDFYAPLFRHEGLWAMFSHQHGPHRQGIGFLLTAGLAQLTDYDARGDAFLVLSTIVVACLCAFVLAWRCGATPGLPWVPLPVLFLTLRQYESWLGAANCSHGAMPVLLLVLQSLSWFIRDRRLRLAALAVLTFLSIFTGFALFAGLVTPLLLVREAAGEYRAGRKGDVTLIVVALILIAASWTLFSHGHYQNPASTVEFHWWHQRPWEYLYFVMLLFASALGLTHEHLPLAFAGGGIALLCVLALLVWHGRTIWREGPTAHPIATVIFFLSAFALLYCAGTAVGRVAMSWDGAPYASRYVTLMIPAFVAIYLHLVTQAAAWWRRSGLVLLVFATAPVALWGTGEDLANCRWLHDGKTRWREVYLATGDFAQAEKTTQTELSFSTYPGNIDRQLEYLRRHNLNLFKQGSFFDQLPP
jgi:hypothetical protein